MFFLDQGLKLWNDIEIYSKFTKCNPEDFALLIFHKSMVTKYQHCLDLLNLYG